MLSDTWLLVEASSSIITNVQNPHEHTKVVKDRLDAHGRECVLGACLILFVDTVG
jgi:hypothetical protein